jgi:uncharacterized delta-60 repeat protein
VKLRTNQLKLASTLVLGAMLSYGCGDDDSPGSQPSGGDGGVTSSDAGSTSSSSDDSSTSDSNSTAETSSESDAATSEPISPEAGTEPEADGGITDETSEELAPDAGPDGSVPPVEFAPIEEVRSQLHTFATDLRGATFSADGTKFFVSGFIDQDSDRHIVVARFNANGTLDEAFGTDGYVVHNLVERVVLGEGDSSAEPVVVNDGTEESLALVQLGNGDLLVQANVRAASGVGTDIVLVKLDAEGQRVSGFGTNGVLRVDLGWTPEDDASWPTANAGPVDNAWDLRLDPSSETEKVVLFAHGPAPRVTEGTQRVDNDRYVLRLLASDGSPDPDFTPYRLNTGGTFSDGGRRGHVNADGSILSAGYTNYGEGLGNHVVAVRLLPNGTPDASFGFGSGIPGVVRTNPFIDDGGISECYAFLPQSNGRYVSTGYGRATAAGVLSRLGWSTTDAVDLVSFGFTATGLDDSYGTQATLAIQSEERPGYTNTEDRGRDLVVLSDDRVVHVGRFGDRPAIFVTLPDGSPDANSGVDGRFEYDPTGEVTSHFFKAALSPDGKTIVATTNNHANGALVAVLRVSE